MCTSVKSPTPKEPEVKDPIYMRNPWLDGLGISGEARGRNSLRIDLGSPVPGPTPATPPPAVTPPPSVRPTPGRTRGASDPAQNHISTVARSKPIRIKTQTTGGPASVLAIGSPTTGGPLPASPYGPVTGGPNPPTRVRTMKTGGRNPPQRGGA